VPVAVRVVRAPVRAARVPLPVVRRLVVGLVVVGLSVPGVLVDMVLSAIPLDLV